MTQLTKKDFASLFIGKRNCKHWNEGKNYTRYEITDQICYHVYEDEICTFDERHLFTNNTGLETHKFSELYIDDYGAIRLIEDDRRVG